MILSTALVLILLICGTVIAVLYATGYRIVPKNGRTVVEGTGLLVLTSKPDGARVYVNNKLTTATDQTINLEPNTYEIKIEKDGYFTWKKKITIKEGEVSQAYALLFPTTPKLEPITTTGANHVIVNNTASVIAYTVMGSTPRKNGIYLIDMTSRPILPIGSVSTQLIDETSALFSSANLSFSPDANELLASISGELGQVSYLLKTNGFNQSPQNVTTTIQQTMKEWEKIKLTQNTQSINSLSRALRTTALNNFKDLSISPQEDKILYTASISAKLSPILKSPLKGVNSTPENRELVAGNTYVYDIKEDRNYLVFDASQNTALTSPEFIWHPDSNHLIFLQDNKIQVSEFDGANLTTLYAGPFLDDFLSIWPDGSNLVIMTNLNTPTFPANLYRISLR